MAVIAWRSEFKTGFPSVDFEHERLVMVINRLAEAVTRDASPHQVLRQLGEIHALIEAHFALEERIMVDLSYVGYAEHKADHDRLLDEIRDIMESVEKDAGFDFQTALGEKLGRWFGVHFRTLDPKLNALTKALGLR